MIITRYNPCEGPMPHGDYVLYSDVEMLISNMERLISRMNSPSAKVKLKADIAKITGDTIQFKELEL